MPGAAAWGAEPTQHPGAAPARARATPFSEGEPQSYMNSPPQGVCTVSDFDFSREAKKKSFPQLFWILGIFCPTPFISFFFFFFSFYFIGILFS